MSKLFLRAERFKSFAATFLAILIALFGVSADAATVHDGDNFSITIDGQDARVCIFFPESARDSIACAGLKMPASLPTSPDRRDLAMGLIRFADGSEATLAVTFVPEQHATVPEYATVEAFAKSVWSKIIADHPGARLRAGTSHVDVQYISGVTVARLTFDLDGLNDVQRRFLGHQVYYVAWAEDGLYAVSLGGKQPGAVDTLADSSINTLKVLHPPPYGTLHELRTGAAVTLWYLLALATIIDFLWAFLRRGQRLPTPAGVSETRIGTPVLKPSAILDVSFPARQRKRIGWAAPSLKIIGFYWAFFGVGYLGTAAKFYPSHSTHHSISAGLIFFLIFLSGAFQIAKWLRAGRAFSWWLASTWFVLSVGFAIYFAVKHVNTGLGDFGMSIEIVTPVFLFRGLVAFRALREYQKNVHNTSDPLARHPWEKGSYISSRPKFINQRNFGARFLLLLAPIPFLWVALQHNPEAHGITRADDLLGYNIAILAFAIGAVAWGALIYRHGRRAAMMPGSEVIKRDPRPIVLYLRSFQDDTGIKLRARATDGRVWPERFVKISFEELVTDHLWGYGPVLAIGDPRIKEKLAPLGAARDYETDKGWHDAVKQLMRQSSMIVVIAGLTEGLAWEIGTIVEQGLVWKLVILLPPLDTSDLERRWQSLSRFAVAPMLPGQIDLARVRGIVFPSNCASLIIGNERDEWTYEAVLDEAALIIASQSSTKVTEATNINSVA